MRQSIKGTDRELWYLLPLEIGLRKGDLQRLVWDNVEFLEDGGVQIHIKEQKAKNRAPDVLPISNSYIVNLLKKRFVEQESNLIGKVFPQAVTDRRRDKDFKLAGIEKYDARGRVVDLHSLRMTLATSLVDSGTSNAQLQSIMRHADLRTTLTFYTDPNSQSSIDAKQRR